MTSAADVERCARCNARIIWTITAKGQRMPVNAEPAKDGNQAIHKDGAGTLKSRALTADRPTLEHAEWQAMPHFVTCAAPPPKRPRGAPRPLRRPAPWWRSR
jgi:hypothetical protein